MTAQNEKLQAWLQENPGMRARYETAPEGGRKMLEIWAALDAKDRKRAAQLIQASAFQEGALARELKALAAEALDPPPEG